MFQKCNKQKGADNVQTSDTLNNWKSIFDTSNHIDFQCLSIAKSLGIYLKLFWRHTWGQFCAIGLQKVKDQSILITFYFHSSVFPWILGYYNSYVYSILNWFMFLDQPIFCMTTPVGLTSRAKKSKILSNYTKKTPKFDVGEFVKVLTKYI